MWGFMEKNNERLFEGKEENYDRYRPDYPAKILEILTEKTCFSRASVVADIGSGTGILARMFLRNGNTVYCVEPNDSMRKTAEKNLGSFHEAKFIKGSAEKTGLGGGEIDLITAGQSFHWFNPELSRVEFKRILKNEGHVMLIWNDRNEQENIISREYGRISKKYSPTHKGTGIADETFNVFFQNGFEKITIKNQHKLDLNGLIGRYFSTSYAISQGDKNYGKLIQEFKDLFDKYQKNGFVTMDYDTNTYIGKV